MKNTAFLGFCLLFCILMNPQAFSEDIPLSRIDRQAALAAAMVNNPAYLAAMEDSRGAWYVYRGSFSELLPSASATWNSRNTRYESSLTAGESSVLSADFNIFRGFNSYRSIRTSRLNLASMQASERETLLNMIRDINLAYQEVLRTDYLRRSNAVLFESADLVMKEAEVRQRLDLITRADLYGARADREKAYSALLDAEVNYAAALYELSRLTGLPLDTSTEVEADERVFTLMSLEDYRNAALGNNTTLMRSYLNTDIARQTYRSAYGSFLPSVDLSVSSGWYEERYSDYNSNQIGITASWNFFSGFYDINNALAKARELNSTRLKAVENKDLILKQIQVAYLQARVSHDKVASAELYVQAAEENYKALQEMFRLGRASLRETVDARATLEDAQALLADARYIMVQAYEELTVLTGGFYGSY